MKNLLFLLFILLSLVGCKKESNRKHCWTLFDFQGNITGNVYDISENQLWDKYGGDILFDSCSYERCDDKMYCFLVDDLGLTEMSRSRAELKNRCLRIGGYHEYVEVPCDYKIRCERCWVREKAIYKPTGEEFYTHYNPEKFCDDTLATIFNGRELIRKDDADSLVIIQFLRNE